MEPYRVGALADLISSSNGEAKKKTKTKVGSDDFFSSRLPPVPKVESPAVVKVPKKRPQDQDDKSNIKKIKVEGKSPTPKKSKNENGKNISEKKSKIKSFDGDSSDDENEEKYTKPSLKHQVRMEDEKERIRDEEKEGRTVFVGNLPVDTTSKTLKNIFKEFGEIDSIRFRGAARPDLKTTKKVAVIKRKFHEKHQRIIAFVRFVDKDAAVKSCSLNGFDLNGVIIRVDMATATPAEKDQKRAIFIGNLPFSAEEDDIRNHFLCCGPIDSIRLVRDSSTGMGKGFGYVNFVSADSVETAIQRNGTELLGRPVRVGRSVRKPKATVQLATKVKKGSLDKKKSGPKLINKKVVKISKKKQREAETPSFQGLTADGSGDDPKGQKKPKKKKNRMEAKKKAIAKKFSKA